MTITNAMITEQIEKAVAENSSNRKIKKIVPMTDWIADGGEVLTRDFKVAQPEKNSYFNVWIDNDGSIELIETRVFNEKEFYRSYYKHAAYGRIPDNTDNDIVEEEIIDFFAEHETNCLFDEDNTEIEAISYWKADRYNQDCMEYKVTKFYSMGENKEEERKERIIIKDTSRIFAIREEKNFITLYDATDLKAEEKYNEELENESKKIDDAVNAKALEKETRKNYKDFEKKYIGSSDYSSLVLAGCSKKGGAKLKELHFGEDESYNAYIVTEPVEIPEHYKKVTSFRNWLKIYDDSKLAAEFQAKKITIYRAGEFGCIIQLGN